MIDWEKLRREYFDLRAVLDPLFLPTAAELTEHKVLASLGREYKSTLSLKIGYGHSLYPGSPSYNTQVNDLREQVVTGGSSQHFGVASCFDEIEGGLASETLSTEFILAWGYLGVLVGRQHELLVQNETVGRVFADEVRTGAAQDVQLQRRWYARWILQHTGGNKSKRADVEFELAELCFDLWQGRRVSPVGYDPAWFEKLICKEDANSVPEKGSCGPIHIKSSFHKLGWDRLQTIAGDDEAALSLHPPLSIEAYPAR